MLELKHASNGKEFQKNAKEYVINMLGNKRKLHKKNGCYYSKCYCKYYDFNTISEAENSGIDFLKCKICFKEI
ncbi:MAG: hypothetical protein J6A96_05550 [Clostridia bacterium]|nr:hypothetical protein [Clostridia bacterium]